jgi:hypothetical protein
MTSLAVISNTWERTYHREEKRFTDEIKITDVGGTFVTIDELTPDQKVVLARFIHESTESLCSLPLELAGLPQR